MQEIQHGALCVSKEALSSESMKLVSVLVVTHYLRLPKHPTIGTCASRHSSHMPTDRDQRYPYKARWLASNIIASSAEAYLDFKYRNTTGVQATS